MLGHDKRRVLSLDDLDRDHLDEQSIDAQRQSLEAREIAEKVELEQSLRQMNAERMDRLRQIDAKLADQVDGLHLEMDSRQHEAIARHEKTMAEIQRKKTALEQQAYLDHANGFGSSSGYNISHEASSNVLGSSTLESNRSQGSLIDSEGHALTFRTDSYDSNQCASVDEDGVSEVATEAATGTDGEEETEEELEDHQEDYLSHLQPPEKGVYSQFSEEEADDDEQGQSRQFSRETPQRRINGKLCPHSEWC